MITLILMGSISRCVIQLSFLEFTVIVPYLSGEYQLFKRTHSRDSTSDSASPTGLNL
jgi:hypothetical protein